YSSIHCCFEPRPNRNTAAIFHPEGSDHQKIPLSSCSVKPLSRARPAVPTRRPRAIRWLQAVYAREPFETWPSSWLSQSMLPRCDRGDDESLLQGRSFWDVHQDFHSDLS